MKTRNTPAKRQPANTSRRRARKNSRKRTRVGRRRSSMGMPRDTSRLERGGREFLQRLHRNKNEAARELCQMRRTGLCRPNLRADGGAEGVGEGLGEAVDIGFVFGFDHDAGELLGARVAKDDAAVFAESRLGFG